MTDLEQAEAVVQGLCGRPCDRHEAAALGTFQNHTWSTLTDVEQAEAVIEGLTDHKCFGMHGACPGYARPVSRSYGELLRDHNAMTFPRDFKLPGFVCPTCGSISTRG